MGCYIWLDWGNWIWQRTTFVKWNKSNTYKTSCTLQKWIYVTTPSSKDNIIVYRSFISFQCCLNLMALNWQESNWQWLRIFMGLIMKKDRLFSPKSCHKKSLLIEECSSHKWYPMKLTVRVKVIGSLMSMIRWVGWHAQIEARTQKGSVPANALTFPKAPRPPNAQREKIK